MSGHEYPGLALQKALRTRKSGSAWPTCSRCDWALKLGTSPERLRELVAQVGPRVSDLRQRLSQPPFWTSLPGVGLPIDAKYVRCVTQVAHCLRSGVSVAHQLGWKPLRPSPPEDRPDPLGADQRLVIGRADDAATVAQRPPLRALRR